MRESEQPPQNYRCESLVDNERGADVAIYLRTGLLLYRIDGFSFMDGNVERVMLPVKELFRIVICRS